MNYKEYKERTKERYPEMDAHGGYKRCHTCGREFYERFFHGDGYFCSEKCRKKFAQLAQLQRRIEAGMAPAGYCQHREDCLNCPEPSCTAEKFAFADPYCY